MKFCPLLLSFAAALFLAAAAADGDPVAFRSALFRSGSPASLTIADIGVVGERLRIVPHGPYTDVEVRYLLHNGSARDYDDIDCGFPVDCMGEGGYRYVDCDDMSERRQAYGWRDDCIRRVMFAANGVSLPCAASGGTTVKPAAKYVMREFLEEDGAA